MQWLKNSRRFGEECLKRRDGSGEKWGTFQAKDRSATILQDRGKRNDNQEELGAVTGMWEFSLQGLVLATSLLAT